MVGRFLWLLSHLAAASFSRGDCELKFAHSSATKLDLSVARYRNQPLYLEVDDYQASLFLDLHLSPCVLGLNKTPAMYLVVPSIK